MGESDKPAPIRYYLDEHVFPGIAVALRSRGVDALTTIEAGMEQASDAEQLEYAWSQDRVFVTRDVDFLVLAAQGARHAGIVRWHPRHRSISEVVQQLTLLWRTTAAEEMRGQVKFV